GQAALRALEHGWPSAHAWLRAERATSFAGKWHFNRAVRALVSSPIAIDAAGLTARIAPSFFRGLVAKAGDCYVCRRKSEGRNATLRSSNFALQPSDFKLSAVDVDAFRSRPCLLSFAGRSAPRRASRGGAARARRSRARRRRLPADARRLSSRVRR